MELLTLPAQRNSSQNLQKWSFIATIIGAIATSLSAVFIAWQVRVTVSQYNSDNLEQKQRESQQVAVSRIISDAGIIKGVGLEGIRGKYLDFVAQNPDLALPEEQLSDNALYAIIMDLELFGVVAKNAAGNYFYNVTTVNPRFDRDPAEQKARYYILDFLRTESGKYTLEQLESKIKTVGLTADEFSLLANELTAQGLIMIEKNLVWSRVAKLTQPNGMNKP